MLVTQGVGTQPVAVHPVAVYVASLAIVETWWTGKGSDASFLVQVGKVRTYE